MTPEEKAEVIGNTIIDEQANKVFEEVSKGKNITRFCVEEPSLNEIFIETVGETYE